MKVVKGVNKIKKSTWEQPKLDAHESSLADVKTGFFAGTDASAGGFSTSQS